MLPEATKLGLLTRGDDLQALALPVLPDEDARSSESRAKGTLSAPACGGWIGACDAAGYDLRSIRADAQYFCGDSARLFVAVFLPPNIGRPDHVLDQHPVAAFALQQSRDGQPVHLHAFIFAKELHDIELAAASSMS